MRRPLPKSAIRNIPVLENNRQLADWLQISLSDLKWLCDAQRSDQPARPPRHYIARWVRKRSVGWRLLESPKPLLKELQQKINSEILNQIDPHPLACGFRVQHTILDFAKPHIRRAVCLKMDLADFFSHARIGRVNRLFQAIGYPRDVSYRLGLLATVQSKVDWLHERHPNFPSPLNKELRNVLGFRRLPQGAPTSPALANLCAYRLDTRLAGLARSVGGVHYTRYADDLLFSGNPNFNRGAEKFCVTVGAIAFAEGFSVNFRKTCLMRSSQRQKAGGIVLNEKLNIDRREFDKLKATLTNCVRHGLASQNQNCHPHFLAHLRGRVEWVKKLNPVKGAKLLTLLNQIEDAG